MHKTSKHTKVIDEEPVDQRVQSKHNGAAHNLRPHNALSLQVSVGGDEACIAKDHWQCIPA